MAERSLDLNAPDIGLYLYRLLREEAGGESFGVERAVLEELIAELDNGVQLGYTEKMQQRSADAAALATKLLEALEAIAKAA